MRRPFRYASILVPVSILILWISSYSYENGVRRDTGNAGGLAWWITSIAGRIEIEWGIDPEPIESHGYFTFDHMKVEPGYDTTFEVRDVHFVRGFALARSTELHGPPGPRARVVPGEPFRMVTMLTTMIVVPYWALTLLGLVSSAVVFYRRRRLPSDVQVANLRFCKHCGYDLRATSDRCPECGTLIRVRTTAT